MRLHLDKPEARDACASELERLARETGSWAFEEAEDMDPLPSPTTGPVMTAKGADRLIEAMGLGIWASHGSRPWTECEEEINDQP